CWRNSLARISLGENRGANCWRNSLARISLGEIRGAVALGRRRARARLLAHLVLALGELLDHLRVEGGEIVGLAAGDEALVDVGLVEVVEHLDVTLLGRDQLDGRARVLERLARLGVFDLLDSLVGGEDRDALALEVLGHRSTFALPLSATAPRAPQTPPRGARAPADALRPARRRARGGARRGAARGRAPT